MKKNVLIVAYNPPEIVGGMEKYNLSLIRILKTFFPNIKIHFAIVNLKNADIKVEEKDDIRYHYVPNYKLNNKNFLGKIIDYSKEKKWINEFIDSLVERYDFSIIINSTYIYLKNVSYRKGYFLVQHNDSSRYLKPLFQRKKILSNFITNFYLRFFLHYRNLIKFAKNIVVYDEINAKKLRKYTGGKIYPISLYSKSFEKNILDEDLKKRNRILYLGRISKIDKNIDGLININNELKLVDFFGLPSFEDGEKWRQILISNGWYLGFSTNEQEIANVIMSHKFVIIYSNYEGFSFSLVEALGCGVPIIVKNTFTSASFLCNKDTGLLLSKNSTFEEDIKKIIEFYNMPEDKYNNYVYNCLKFHKKNLTFSIFETKWKEIFSEYL